MASPQELFIEGAEDTAKGLGERHGYSMLVGGLERMFKGHGHDFTSQEIAFWVHHHELGQFLNDAAKPETVDVRLFARAFDLTWLRKPEPSWELRAAMEGRDGSYFFGQRSHVEWIENELVKTLRERKIRRGTKAYASFVSLNAPKVLAAVRQEVEAAAKRKQDSITERLTELNKRRDTFVDGAAGLERRLTFRQALLSVTGVEPDPRSEENVAVAKGHFRMALERLDSTIDYLQREFAEVEQGTDAAVQEALASSKELAPFASGPPRACDCEG